MVFILSPPFSSPSITVSIKPSSFSEEIQSFKSSPSPQSSLKKEYTRRTAGFRFVALSTQRIRTHALKSSHLLSNLPEKGGLRIFIWGSERGYKKQRGGESYSLSSFFTSTNSPLSLFLLVLLHSESESESLV